MAVQSPELSGDATALAAVVPSGARSVTSAVEPSVPLASGQGVAEFTPIEAPARPVPGENASDPGGYGESATRRKLKASATITSAASSTAMPSGSLTPLNGGVVWVVARDASSRIRS